MTQIDTVILNRLNRIDIYLTRVRQDWALGNPVQAMADTAELAEIARRLYQDFQVADLESNPPSRDRTKDGH